MADERLWIYAIADSGITSRGIMLEPIIAFSETLNVAAGPGSSYDAAFVERGTTEAMWYIDGEGVPRKGRLVTVTPLSVAAPINMTAPGGTPWYSLGRGRNGGSKPADSVFANFWPTTSGGINGWMTLFMPTGPYDEIVESFTGGNNPGDPFEYPIYTQLTATVGLYQHGGKVRVNTGFISPPTLTDCTPPAPEVDCDIFNDADTKPKLLANDGVRAVAMYEKPNVSGNHFMGVISVSGDVPTLDSEVALSFTFDRGQHAGGGDHLEHLADSIYVYGQRDSASSTGPKFRKITAGTVISVEAPMFPSSFMTAWDATTIEVFALIPLDAANIAIVYYVRDIALVNAKIAIRTFNINTGSRDYDDIVVRTDTGANMSSSGIYMALVGSKLIVSWHDRPTVTKRLSTYSVLV